MSQPSFRPFYFSTHGLSLPQAKSFLVEQVGPLTQLVHYDIPKNERFELSAGGVSLGPATLFEVHSTEHQVERSPNHVASDGVDCFALNYVYSGHMTPRTKAKEVTFGAGGIGLGDIGEPWRITFGQATHFRVLYLPRPWLGLFVPVPEDLLYRELSSSSGWGRALAAVISELKLDSLEELALPPHAILEQIASLLALSAGPGLRPLKTDQKLLLDRLRRDMRDQFFMPALDPASFALEHRISTRTLHALFASAGTSFMQDLVSMRLDHASCLLANPSFDKKTIREVALMVGFVNESHFCARFRRAYGVSPAAYRSRTRGK